MNQLIKNKRKNIFTYILFSLSFYLSYADLNPQQNPFDIKQKCFSINYYFYFLIQTQSLIPTQKDLNNFDKFYSFFYQGLSLDSYKNNESLSDLYKRMEAFNTFLSQKRSQININENKNPDRNRIYNYFNQLSEGLNGHSINQDFRNNPKKITVKQFNTLKETIDTIYKDLQIEKFCKLQNVFYVDKVTEVNCQLSLFRFNQYLAQPTTLKTTTQTIKEEQLLESIEDMSWQIYAIDNYFNYDLFNTNIIKYFYINLNLQNLPNLQEDQNINLYFHIATFVENFEINNQQNNNQEDDQEDEAYMRYQVFIFFKLLNETVNQELHKITKKNASILTIEEWNKLKEKLDLISNALTITIFCTKEDIFMKSQCTKENYQASIDNFFNPTTNQNPTKILSMKLILIILGILGIIIFFLTIGKLSYNKYNQNKAKDQNRINVSKNIHEDYDTLNEDQSYIDE